VITWTRSLNKLPVNRYVIDGDTLTIKNTIEDDGGAYICQGANELGSVMAVTWVVVTDEGEQINPSTFPSTPHPPPLPNTQSLVGKILLLLLLLLFYFLSESLHCVKSSQQNSSAKCRRLCEVTLFR